MVQQSTVYGLKSSLSTQRKARPSFDPRRGHHGRFIIPDPPNSTEASGKNNKKKNTVKSSTDTDADEEDEEDDVEQNGHDEAEDEEMEFEDVDHQPANALASADVPQVKRARFD